jgi:hypothetical protein
METALHQFGVWVEKALDQQETALGVFVDIEGAFNYTSFDTIYAALVKHGVATPFSGGLELSGGPQQFVMTYLRVAVSRGCLQEGVLLLLLWCLFVDDLMARLNVGCVDK